MGDRFFPTTSAVTAMVSHEAVDVAFALPQHSWNNDDPAAPPSPPQLPSSSSSRLVDPVAPLGGQEGSPGTYFARTVAPVGPGIEDPPASG